MSPRPLRLLPMAVTLGGVLVATGATLPWLTLYGGLHPLPGTMGWLGKGIGVAGALLAALGLLAWRRPSRPLLLAVGTAGAALGLALGVRLDAAVAFAQDPSHVMLVPALGPGLLVAVAGAVLATLAAMGGAWRAPVRAPR